MDSERDLFSPAPEPPPPAPPPPKIKLHSRYRGFLREMKEHKSRIVEFPFAGRGLQRIRLEHWPRHKGITEKGLRAMIDGGFVRKMIFHAKSKAATRYDLTTLGEEVASL